MLKSRSRDINRIQKIIDPLVILIFFKIFIEDKFQDFSIFYIGLFIINLSILKYYKIYESFREKNLINLIPKILLICCGTTFLSLLITKKNLPIETFKIIEYFLATFFYLITHHVLIRSFLRYLRRYGINTRNIIFFGNKESYKFFLNEIIKYPWLGYRIKYWFSPNESDFKKELFNDLGFQPCIGGIDKLEQIIISGNIDKVFFSNCFNDEISFKETLKILGDSCIPVSYVIDWNKKYMSLEKEYIGDIMALNIWNPKINIVNQTIKMIFDYTFGLILLITISPILCIISILIKLTSNGPILYSQERYGLNGKIFKMFKFRTMNFEKNEKLEQAKINDKRITKIGKFLRKYSLDELPQLINVIKGEMSLVGPRPHAVEHNEYYRKLIIGYMQRHSNLPGMTGLAQINGARGETRNIEDMNLRIDYDLQYNNNWTLMTDFIILFKTFFCILKGDAY